MTKATTLKEVLDVFNLDGLTDEAENIDKTFDSFYNPDTMVARTGDKYDSPMLDLYERCQQLGGQNAHLLLERHLPL